MSRAFYYETIADQTQKVYSLISDLSYFLKYLAPLQFQLLTNWHWKPLHCCQAILAYASE